MRRLILGCLVLGGCLKANPAWQGGDADASGTSGVIGEVSSTGGSMELPTTSAGEETGGATDSQGEPSTGAASVTTTTTATSASTSTGEDASSTGEGSSTGALGAKCMGQELLLVDIEGGSLHDAGVVPDSMPNPCPWNAGVQECGTLNFGKTGFFRLVNEQAGKSAALIRFDGDAVQEFLEEAGYAATDVIDARIELVVYEPFDAPQQDSTLEIKMLVGDASLWVQGGGDAEVAKGSESSGNCWTFDGDCKKWPNIDAVESSEAVGILLVTAQAVAATQDDGLGGQYHAKLRSEPLKKLAAAYAEGQEPSLVVLLSTERGLGEPDIGIKLKEAQPWADPTLLLEVCTMWAP